MFKPSCADSSRSNSWHSCQRRCSRAFTAKLLRAARITGWRRHTMLLGRPDFTFCRERVVIFVDGCFWHRCPKHSNMPANNREFWEPKLARNTMRDRLVTRTLRQRGWRVLRIWEHDLIRKNQPGCIKKVRAFLEG